MGRSTTHRALRTQPAGYEMYSQYHLGTRHFMYSSQGPPRGEGSGPQGDSRSLRRATRATTKQSARSRFAPRLIQTSWKRRRRTSGAPRPRVDDPPAFPAVLGPPDDHGPERMGRNRPQTAAPASPRVWTPSRQRPSRASSVHSPLPRQLTTTTPQTGGTRSPTSPNRGADAVVVIGRRQLARKHDRG